MIARSRKKNTGRQKGGKSERTAFGTAQGRSCTGRKKDGSAGSGSGSRAGETAGRTDPFAGDGAAAKNDEIEEKKAQKIQLTAKITDYESIAALEQNFQKQRKAAESALQEAEQENRFMRATPPSWSCSMRHMKPTWKNIENCLQPIWQALQENWQPPLSKDSLVRSVAVESIRRRQ